MRRKTFERFESEADLVVLATGMVPNRAAGIELARDEYGFLAGEQPAGHCAAGCALAPLEVSSAVQEGTAAAMTAILAAR